jgi:molecular chaperone GrpE
MSDRQTLFTTFLDWLHREPSLVDYLDQEPETIPPFDPYQMVAEWVALRHEVKQQGKLLQSSQQTLQQALEEMKVDKTQLQQQLENSQHQHKTQTEREQKSLFLDLLGIVDALDQACDYWQTQLNELPQSAPSSSSEPVWKRWLRSWLPPEPSTSPSDLKEILVSNQQGIDLIRRSLLDVLRQRQVTPITAKGELFDAQYMYAVGRQPDASVPENTVIQEVVRGYTWRGQILREAQVIVATSTS